MACPTSSWWYYSSHSIPSDALCFIEAANCTTTILSLPARFVILFRLVVVELCSIVLAFQNLLLDVQFLSSFVSKRSSSRTTFAPNAVGFASQETLIFCKLDLVIESFKPHLVHKLHRFASVNVKKCVCKRERLSRKVE